MLQVDCDSLPASQAEAVALLEAGMANGQIIGAAQLATLVGKAKASFKLLGVQVWTSPPNAWIPLSECTSLLDVLNHKVMQQSQKTAPATPHCHDGRHAPPPLPTMDFSTALLPPPHALQPTAMVLGGRSLQIFSTDEVIAALLSSISLGSGGFGSVSRCLLNGRDIALKFPHHTPDYLHEELSFALFDKLCHPNIIRLVGCGSIDPSKM